MWPCVRLCRVSLAVLSSPHGCHRRQGIGCTLVKPYSGLILRLLKIRSLTTWIAKTVSREFNQVVPALIDPSWKTRCKLLSLTVIITVDLQRDREQMYQLYYIDNFYYRKLAMSRLCYFIVYYSPHFLFVFLDTSTQRQRGRQDGEITLNYIET